MSAEQSGPFCSKCGRDRTNDQGATDLPHTECPDCGSTELTYRLKVDAMINTHASMGAKLRRIGKARPILEIKQGASYNKDNDKWLQVEQIVNRQDDRYKKKIIDPQTGAVLRDDDGKLSEHQGFGDAKSN